MQATEGGPVGMQRRIRREDDRLACGRRVRGSRGHRLVGVVGEEPCSRLVGRPAVPSDGGVPLAGVGGKGPRRLTLVAGKQRRPTPDVVPDIAAHGLVGAAQQGCRGTQGGCGPGPGRRWRTDVDEVHDAVASAGTRSGVPLPPRHVVGDRQQHVLRNVELPSRLTEDALQCPRRGQIATDVDTRRRTCRHESQAACPGDGHHASAQWRATSTARQAHGAPSYGFGCAFRDFSSPEVRCETRADARKAPNLAIPGSSR